MKKALLLVDIQNDYFPGGKMELVGMKAAAAQAQALLAEFRRRQWPTYHIQHVSLRKGAPFFLPDTPGVAIHEVHRPAPGRDRHRKALPQRLPGDRPARTGWLAAGMKELVICGAMSHMCIDATTRAAVDLGFTCTVIHDACATRDLTFGEVVIPARQVHGAFMAALASFYARVVSAEDFWRRSTKSKPISHIILNQPREFKLGKNHPPFKRGAGGINKRLIIPLKSPFRKRGIYKNPAFPTFTRLRTWLPPQRGSRATQRVAPTVRVANYTYGDAPQ